MKGLRIGFFGTDNFSIHAMSRVLQLQKSKPGLINSIDLITRPPKRFRKQLVDVPIAKEFPQLNTLRVDSKSDLLDLLLDPKFNLIIAVSFGMLIPAQLIQTLEFGGLNVHPSLLPKYSGASPLQYALLNDDKSTGVSVQTLHPTKFDLGLVLAQEQGVPIQDTDNYFTLQDRLGAIGGDLLCKVIEEQAFVDPVGLNTGFEYSYAPKVTMQDYRVAWSACSSRQIFNRSRAFSQLFTYIYCDVYSKLQKRNLKSYKRVILEDIRCESCSSDLRLSGEFSLDSQTGRLLVRAGDGNLISVGSILMETFKKEDPTQFMTSLKKRTGSSNTRFVESIEGTP